jgi:hypothetical protein
MALAGGLLNIVLSIGLVKSFGLGLTGVALGSAAALLMVSGYVVFYALRLMQLSPLQWLRQGCGRAVLCLVPLIAVLLLLRGWWYPANLLAVFVQFGLVSLAYGAGVWGWGLTASERSQLLDLVVRLAGRMRGGTAHG